MHRYASDSASTIATATACVVGSALLAGCAPPPVAADAASPPFVDALIASLESGPVANPPASIWRYTYRGRTVWFVPARCCDITSQLYDARGDAICQPDGGFSGRGDGRCPDFPATRRDGVRVWVDPRG